MTAFIGGVLFANDGAMMVNPLTPSGVATYNAAFRTDGVGCVYINTATTPDASNTVFNGGLGFSRTTGALYCTETAPGATSTTSGGISRNALGQAHVTFVKPSPVIFQNGYALSNTGVLYVAGITAAPTAWYRYGLGITSAASLVSAWADQSGNGNNLVQSTATNKPTLDSDGSILFDGADNFMSAVFTLDQPATIYLLVKQVSWTLNDQIFNSGVLIFQGGTTPRIRLFAGASTTEDPNLAVGSYGALAAVFNGASSVSQVNTSAAITSNAGATNPTGFALGNTGVGGANFAVKEGIAFPTAHDATERARVINYLSAVGGLNL